MLFDNVTIEKLTYDEFNSVSDSSEVKKLELKTTTESTTIKNSVFNLAKPNGSYPVPAQNWTSEIENKNNNVAGIINTNQSLFDNSKEFLWQHNQSWKSTRIFIRFRKRIK